MDNSTATTCITGSYTLPPATNIQLTGRCPVCKYTHIEEDEFIAFCEHCNYFHSYWNKITNDPNNPYYDPRMYPINADQIWSDTSRDLFKLRLRDANERYMEQLFSVL